jgi:hypothetical protein
MINKKNVLWHGLSNTTAYEDHYKLFNIHFFYVLWDEY